MIDKLHSIMNSFCQLIVELIKKIYKISKALKDTIYFTAQLLFLTCEQMPNISPAPPSSLMKTYVTDILYYENK